MRIAEKFEQWLQKEHDEAFNRHFISTSNADSDFWCGRTDALADVINKFNDTYGGL